MENKVIHLVLTYIDYEAKKAKSYYIDEMKIEDCKMLISFWSSCKELTIPLWFDTDTAACAYVNKANSDTEREFYVIQEFKHPKNTILKDEAKIIFNCKSDEWIVMEEGRTERKPNMWANVRTLSICDKEAAEDYVRRFNEDATAAV